MYNDNDVRVLKCKNLNSSRLNRKSWPSYSRYAKDLVVVGFMEEQQPRLINSSTSKNKNVFIDFGPCPCKVYVLIRLKEHTEPLHLWG